MTHHKADTTARLAQPLGFVTTEHAVEAVRIVASIFRDHGNRADRRHARLKYLLAEWGMERFRAEFARRAAFPLAPPVELPSLPYHDHLGRHRQPDGRWFYGVFVQSGRIADTGGQRLKTALHEIVIRLRPGVRLTGQQNLLLTDLDDAGVEGRGGHPASARGHARAGALGRAAVLHGLPRASHLRARRCRVGARDPRAAGPVRGRARARSGFATSRSPYG